MDGHEVVHTSKDNVWTGKTSDTPISIHTSKDNVWTGKTCPSLPPSMCGPGRRAPAYPPTPPPRPNKYTEQRTMQPPGKEEGDEARRGEEDEPEEESDEEEVDDEAVGEGETTRGRKGRTGRIRWRRG